MSSGVILAIDLGWWWGGEPRYGSMLLNSVAVLYLNQRDVRVALDGMRAMMTQQPFDFELLRRHEPILRLTDGELFFPMAARSSVEACDLLSGPNCARRASRSRR